MKKLFSLLAVVLLIVIAELLYPAPSKSTKKENWPTLVEWEHLNKKVEGRLIQVLSTKQSCLDDPSGEMCQQTLGELKNPFLIQKYPWATQSVGWLNAWSTAISPYVVAAEKTQDIVEAVKFARKHQLRVVIKGAAHDYQGRSNAPNSLLIWTHKMRAITTDDAFIPIGAPSETKAIPAVTVEAGARWAEAYDAVTTKGGRYVQGGGCPSVGVAGGFLQGGGFGSFSKKYGTAAGSLLEAEVVVASGEVLIANAYQNADLFWALKGGGGGTFGVVSKVTLQTHDLPETFGSFIGAFSAKTDEAYLQLIEYFVSFYHKHLMNEHWGEQVEFYSDNSISFKMSIQGLSDLEAKEVWKPFFAWIEEHLELFPKKILFTQISANQYWDSAYYTKNKPQAVHLYQEGDQTLFYWTSNQNEVSAFWYAMQTCWIPASLFDKSKAKEFAQTLFDASRHRPVSLHFNKGLAGAPKETFKRERETSINPTLLDSAALAIVYAKAQEVFPGVPGYEPNIEEGKAQLEKVTIAMKYLNEATPGSGTYSNEADYFQENWQQAFWGKNYSRLLQIKEKYDPDHLFHCHHSVGS